MRYVEQAFKNTSIVCFATVMLIYAPILCNRIGPESRKPVCMRRWKIASFILWPLFLATGVVTEVVWILSYPIRVVVNYYKSRKFYKKLRFMVGSRKNDHVSKRDQWNKRIYL